MARFGHSLPKAKLGGIGMPSWLPDWLTGKDVRPIQGPVYIPPRGKAGGYRKELAADIARKVSDDPYTQRNIYSGVQAAADFVPLIGEDVGVREAAEDWKKGNRISAIAGGLGTVVGTVPIIGDVGGKLIKEGGKRLAKGLGEVADHLPNVEKTASAVVDPVAPQGLGIRAYHGSPHSFDEFDISKIGTGEGAQAYGHGLYFAEHEPVAASYRESLAGPSSIDELKIGNRRVGEKNGFDYSPRGNSTYENIQSSLIEDLLVDELALTADPAKAQQIALTKLKEKIEDYRTEWPEAVSSAQQLYTDLSKPGAVSLKMGERPGHMYEVDIAADPEAFLDYDKLLSEQPHIKQALGLPDIPPGEMTNEQYNAALEQMGFRPEIDDLSQLRGEHLVDARPRKVGGLGAEQRLKQAGIPGIRYLDQGSRDPVKMKELANDLAQYREAAKQWAATGDDAKLAIANKQIEVLEKRLNSTRNYVVFDPKLISIVRRYGIAGALSMGLISEEMARQMQEQGAI